MSIAHKSSFHKESSPLAEDGGSVPTAKRAQRTKIGVEVPWELD